MPLIIPNDFTVLLKSFLENKKLQKVSAYFHQQYVYCQRLDCKQYSNGGVDRRLTRHLLHLLLIHHIATRKK